MQAVTTHRLRSACERNPRSRAAILASNVNWDFNRSSALQKMSLLQLFLVGACGLIVAYWALRIGVRFVHRGLIVVLLLVAAVSAVGLLFPQTFSSAFAGLCS